MGWADLVAGTRRAANQLLGGVPVTAGALSGVGILDMKSELTLEDSVVSIEYALTVESALFGGLQYGSGLVVDGTGYRVRQEPIRIGDGSDCIVMLEKLAGDVGTIPPTIIGGAAAGIPQTVVIPIPAAGDDFPLFRAQTNLILTEVRAVMRAEGTPTLTVRIGHAAGIEDVITDWATDALEVTNQSAGQLATIINQPIVQGRQARVVISAGTGEVRDLTLYLRGVVAG
jgi:hypothetical protein